MQNIQNIGLPFLRPMGKTDRDAKHPLPNAREMRRQSKQYKNIISKSQTQRGK